MRRTGTIHDDDRFELAADVTVVDSHDAGVVTLFHAGRSRYWQGNGATAALLESVTQGATVGAMVDGLHAGTDVPRETVRADVVETLRSLSGARLVRRSRA